MTYWKDHNSKKVSTHPLTDEEEDDEEVYKMAGVMAQCGGLECMLNRLSGIKDFKQGRHLLTVSQQPPHHRALLLSVFHQ